MKREISIIGWGNQGSAWAQNLRDSGFKVQVLLRPESSSFPAARKLGFQPETLGESLKEAESVAVLIPDDSMPAFYQTYGSFLRPEQHLIFAHGFSLHFRTVPWPRALDWILVAPKGIASAVRERFVAGSGVPAVLAVENDATGKSWSIAESIADGLGSTRAGTYRATAREEVEADLFSEQALLCGGLPALVAQTYDILVKGGIKPEVAYLECVHEMAFIADLIQQRGIHETLRFASPTARFGGIKGGELLMSPEIRTALERLLKDIRSGEFAEELSQEAKSGFSRTEASMEELRESSVERVGRSVRDRIQGLKG